MRALVLGLVLLGCSDDELISEVVGATCLDDRDCAELCERGGEFPGGFCTVGCLDDRDCTDDSICADVAGGVCVFECRDDRDCDFLGREYKCKERRDTFDAVVFVCLG